MFQREISIVEQSETEISTSLTCDAREHTLSTIQSNVQLV